MLIYAIIMQLRKPEEGSSTGKFIKILEKYAYHPKTPIKDRVQETPLRMRENRWYSARELGSIFRALRGRVEQYIDYDRARLNKEKMERGGPSKGVTIRNMIKDHIDVLSEARDLVPGVVDEFFSRLEGVKPSDRAAYFALNPGEEWKKDDKVVKDWPGMIIDEAERGKLEKMYEGLEEQDALKKVKRKKDEDEGEEKVVPSGKFDIERKETKQKRILQKGWNIAEFTKWDALKHLVEALKHDADDLALKLKPEMFSISSSVEASDSGGNATLAPVDLQTTYGEWEKEVIESLGSHIKNSKDKIKSLRDELKLDMPEFTFEVEEFKEDQEKIKKMKEEVSAGENALHAFSVESTRKMNRGDLKREDFEKDLEGRQEKQKGLEGEYRKAVQALIFKEIGQKEKELEGLETRITDLASMRQELKGSEEEEKKAEAEERKNHGAPQPIFYSSVIEHVLASFKKYHAMLWSVMWVHQKFEVVKVEDVHRNLVQVKRADVAGRGLETLREVAIRSMKELQDKTDHLAGMPIMARATNKAADLAMKSAQSFRLKSEDFFVARDKQKKPYSIVGPSEGGKKESAERSKADEFDIAFKLPEARQKINKYLGQAGAKNKERQEVLGDLQALYNKLKKEFLEESVGKTDSLLKRIPTEVNEFVKGVESKYEGHKEKEFLKRFPEDKIRDAMLRTVHVLKLGPSERDLVEQELKAFKSTMLGRFREVSEGDEETWFEAGLARELTGFLSHLKQRLMDKSPLKEHTPTALQLNKVFKKEEFEQEMEKKINEHKGATEQLALLKKMHREDIDEIFDFLKSIIAEPPEHLVEDAKKKSITYQEYIESLISPLKSILRASWEPEPEKTKKEFSTKYTVLDKFITDHSSGGENWFPSMSLIDEDVGSLGIGHGLVKIMKENPVLISDMEGNSASFLKKHIVKSHPLVEKTIEKIQNNQNIHGGGGSSSTGREKIVKHIVQGMKEIVEEQLARYLRSSQTPEQFLNGHRGLLYDIALRLKNESRSSDELTYRGDVVNTLVGILKSIPFNMQKVQVGYPRGISQRSDPFTPNQMTLHNPYKKLGVEVRQKPRTEEGWAGFKPSPVVTDKDKQKARGELLFKDLPFKHQPLRSHIEVNSLADAEHLQGRVDDLLEAISKLIAPDSVKGIRYYPKDLEPALRYFREGEKSEKGITNPEELKKVQEKREKELKELAKKPFHSPLEGITPKEKEELKGAPAKTPEKKAASTMLSYKVACNFISFGNITEDEMEMILS